jgi:hypothetical protein
MRLEVHVLDLACSAWTERTFLEMMTARVYESGVKTITKLSVLLDFD